MCLAVPGKVVDITKDEVTVDYGTEKRKGKLMIKDIKKGDYVLIQGGFVVMKIEKKEAEQSLKLYHDALD